MLHMRSTMPGLLICSLPLWACSDQHEAAPRDASMPTPQADDARAFTPDVGALPADWRRARGECGISLSGSALIATAGDSGEYCVATFEDEHCDYRVEYGDFPDPLEHATESSFAFEPAVIAGNEGRVGVALLELSQGTYFAALRLPSIGGEDPQVSLTATAHCSSREALEVARVVLKTVDLAWPGSGLCTGLRPQKCTLLNSVTIRP
jgi:hypothetical protein